MKAHVCPNCCRVLTENDLAEEKKNGGFMPKIPRFIIRILALLRIGNFCSHCMVHPPEESDMITFDDQVSGLDSIKKTPRCCRYESDGMGGYHLTYKKGEYSLFIFGVIFILMGLGITISTGMFYALIFALIGGIMAFFGFKHAFFGLHANLHNDHIEVRYGLGDKGEYKRFERTNTTSAGYEITHSEIKHKKYGVIEFDVHIQKCKVTIYGAEGEYNVIRNVEIGPANYLALFLNWYFKSVK